MIVSNDQTKYSLLRVTTMTLTYNDMQDEPGSACQFGSNLI